MNPELAEKVAAQRALSASGLATSTTSPLDFIGPGAFRGLISSAIEVKAPTAALNGANVTIPTWKGAGPIPGTIGVNAKSTSTKALQNYSPKGAVEYVFDPDTATLVVGKGQLHSPLAASINADVNRVVGGLFGRAPNGAMVTNEASGHFHKNWSPSIRQQFTDMMRSRGFNHTHSEGM